MTETKQRPGLGRLLAISALVGVVTAFACVAILRLIGVDENPALVGGVVGAVTGSVVATLARAKG